MKNLIMTLVIGLIGTSGLYYSQTFSTSSGDSNYKTIQYNRIDNQALSALKDEISALSKEDVSYSLRSLRNHVEALKKPSSLTVEFHQQEQSSSRWPYAILWGSLAMISLLVFRQKEKENDEPKDSHDSENSFQSEVNPTLKKIMSELDFPLFICDQNFEANWRNGAAKNFSINPSLVQRLIAHFGASPDENFELDGAPFKVQISELNYKNGKKNLLLQLKPAVVSNKYLEHLIDSSEVEALLENTGSNNSVFKEYNLTIAEIAVKLNYLFKVSGKFLDIDFKKDIADCFVESHRLSTMSKEFIMSCHYLIKDKEQSSGLYLRTDEVGQRFVLGCFIPGLTDTDLTSGVMARDFLKRFSVLEAKFSICLPTVEIREVSVGEAKGLDIVLSFENRSQMESLINQSLPPM